MDSRVVSLLEFITKNEIKLVDFRFTSVSGKFLHITHHSDSVTEKTLTNGVSFDGSSVPGWSSVGKSDMLLIPDLEAGTSFLDPFAAQPTLCILCDVVEPNGNNLYDHNPRATARKAMQFLRSTGIADKSYFGFEMEFFVLDDARFAVRDNGAFFELDSAEGSYNSGKRYEYNNHGHRNQRKSCYLASQPSDSLNDIRAEILETLKEVKVKPLLHHHEVASSQCEISFQYGEAVKTSDNAQKCKHVIHNVASSYGKSATFMPKPFKNDNGNGMHIHTSLWKGDRNLFAPDNSRGDVSELCTYYIGGVIKYGKALNAILNPLTNSYKRLIPGYEAPCNLDCSPLSRSAAIRIPHSPGGEPSAKRVEVRFPDAGTNPYLGTSALLMAGIAGINEKITPESATAELKKSADGSISLCRSLEEALVSLDKNRDFLLEGNVFTNAQIDAYIALKTEDIEELMKHPVPIEFIKYYSV
ncbi:glutamine synthetase, type I [Neorickettsia helminthoeca str. Oregon]|uniref:Glutamine synthetase n=1 Tax=Neorickettsia helminthoeca str. Oregon TaxID=1286528 RepID=X5H3Z4_9RICK|nr:type I glutamate--ammonia ligase [Neorickettsia helminthoeca]AHX11291.1 glutamine synthetase, type I [Neorickettsia helminthoeca str. Oregon]